MQQTGALWKTSAESVRSGAEEATCHARAHPPSEDGYCGNFNCEVDDDEPEAPALRVGAAFGSEGRARSHSRNVIPLGALQRSTYRRAHCDWLQL